MPCKLCGIFYCFVPGYKINVITCCTASGRPPTGNKNSKLLAIGKYPPD